MTVVTNTLETPDGHPDVGVVVRAHLVPGRIFLADGTKEIVHSANATTDDTGTWTLDLTPQSQLLPANSYYVVTEGSTQHTIAVPDSGPVTLWQALTTPQPADTGLVNPLTEATADLLYVGLDDTRLTNARTPTAHASTHATAGTDPVSPGAIGAAVSGHTHDVSALQARSEKGVANGYASLGSDGLVPTSQLPTSSGSGGVVVARLRYIGPGGSDITPPSSATFTTLPGPAALSVAAAAGKELEVTLCALMQSTNLYLDAAILVSGSPVKYLSSGTATPTVEGIPGWYPATNFAPIAGPPGLTLASGDISGGTVTVALMYKSAGSGRVFATSDYPLQFAIKVFG